MDNLDKIAYSKASRGSAQLEQIELEVNDVNAQLALTALRANVRLKDVKLELEDTSPTFLAAIEGGEGTTFNLLSIPQDGSVTPSKISNAIQGKNIFDKSKATPILLSPSTGNEMAHEERRSSDYIKCDPSTQYIPNFSSRVLFYDENKAFISGIESYNGLAQGTPGEAFTTPSNALFFRTSIHRSDLKYYQVEKGGVATEYEPFRYYLEKMVSISEERVNKAFTVLEKTDGKLTKVTELIGNRTQVTELIYSNGKLDYITIDDIELNNKKKIIFNGTQIIEQYI